MSAGNSGGNDLLKAIEKANRYVRVLQEREEQDFRYGMLLFLLAISVAGLVVLLIRRFA